MLYPILINPACKDNIWGGTKLKKWNKGTTDIVAESWELSLHKNGMSIADNGIYKGMRFDEILANNPDFLGDNAKSFEMFPVLIKFIDAKTPLSIQVHPSDEYALANEGQYGKTEVWYVMDADEGAGIYCGFKNKITKEEYKEAIENNTITDLLNFIEVKAGDIFMINAGTVHAIGAGLTICEVQQNSDVTYRVYDYARVGADGKQRELHVDKAIAVSNLDSIEYVQPTPIVIDNIIKTVVAECKYFKTYKYEVKDSTFVLYDEFVALTILDGEGEFEEYGMKFEAGQTYFLPANCAVTMTGKFTMIFTTV